MFEDTSRRLAGDKARRVRFDAKRFEAQVARLALPQQTFTFSVVEANLLDDPQLATAFAASTRTALAEVPDALSHPAGARSCFLCVVCLLPFVAGLAFLLWAPHGAWHEPLLAPPSPADRHKPTCPPQPPPPKHTQQHNTTQQQTNTHTHTHTRP